jgi:hypothetical protein
MTTPAMSRKPAVQSFVAANRLQVRVEHSKAMVSNLRQSELVCRVLEHENAKHDPEYPRRCSELSLKVTFA